MSGYFRSTPVTRRRSGRARPERDASWPMEVVLADDTRHLDHEALAGLDLVEELFLAGQPEPAAGLDLDARALAFGALGHHERAAFRAAGDRHARRVLGDGALLLRGERDADSKEKKRDSVLHASILTRRLRGMAAFRYDRQVPRTSSPRQADPLRIPR